MIKKGFKKAVRLIGLHGSVLLKGLVRMTAGVSIARLTWSVAHWFTMIRHMEGYAAVFAFLVCTVGALAALGGVYLMGGHPKKEVKK